MDFEPSARAVDCLGRMQSFMDESVFPAEPVYSRQRAALVEAGRAHALPAIVDELKADARSRGLWNLFLPGAGHGLSVLDYAPIAELSGWSPELAPEAINCAAPDTGNMEILDTYGTPEQKSRWLEPLLDGRIRSAFAMTEPGVASSDATNITTSIARQGDHYVINGRKWWTTGAMDPRCAFLIVMGKTDPDAEVHRQQSMVIVPTGTEGVAIERSLPVFGYLDQHGHGEIALTDVRVPVENLLGEQGSGFAIAQARLGPGRIHHCMRAIGMAERALALLSDRALARVAFGRPLADQGVVQQQIAESRLEIEQARLLTLKAAWLIDRVGVKDAQVEIAAIKVAAPRAALAVIDRAIQVFGAAGVSDDTPLASMFTLARALRIADGPDEVHLRAIARAELRRHRA